MKPKVFLDFDGTITNTMEAYCLLYTQLYKDHPDFKEPDHTKVREWHFKDQCPLAADKEICKQMFWHDDFFRYLKPFPNAYEVIQKQQEYYDISICSNGYPENIAKKALWIRDHMPFIKSTVYVNGGSHTGKGIVDMRGALLLDDHIDNLTTTSATVVICYGPEYE